MEKIIKELSGYSGSKIYLMENDQRIFIRKINNIERNFNQLKKLHELGFDVPVIYNKTSNVLDMEYINGLDIKTYFETHNLQDLISFICNLVDKLNTKSKIKDYSYVYKNRLAWLDKETAFSFSKKELIDKLPKELPQSYYHGDLTLENIIYSNKKFYLIDCMTGDYDSWVFDLCKLRQDFKCGWFIRNSKDFNYKNYLNIIDHKINKAFPIINNNSLLILMLLRIYLYAQNSEDKNFLLKEINDLWTS
jgi:tRNA A-37 threonylcarbamoyl transferase component Bud32